VEGNYTEKKEWRDVAEDDFELLLKSPGVARAFKAGWNSRPKNPD
jgi:hypothetical protein